MDLRCEHKRHALLVNGLIEVKCDSQFCGARAGIVVLHSFDPISGHLVKTSKFQDPSRQGREVNIHNGSCRTGTAIRSS